MCGIASIWNWTGRQISFSQLHAMAKAQIHRGPDGQGYAVWQYNGQCDTDCREPLIWHGSNDDTPKLYPDSVRVGLAHNWLAIQDVTPKGQQPMTFGNRRYWIVFNGEIYNFLELRETLLQESVEFSSSSDTEVLLALWHQFGPNALHKLRGMFAFVIYDCEEDVLWAVRDRFGIKPLYYAMLPEQSGIIMASEFRGLHASRLIPRKWNELAVKAFLAVGISKPGELTTFFDDIYELPPGSFLKIQPHKITTHRYYHLPHVTCPELGIETLPELRNHFLEVVNLHLRSVREVGTCMSGGLDSTNIACAISQLLGEQANHFATFSIGSPESDDFKMAQQAAEYMGLRHRLSLSPEVIDLPALVDMTIACETPSHIWGPINQYFLLRQIHNKDGLFVLIDGQGGDEVFSGYPWFFRNIEQFIRHQGEQEKADSLRSSFYSKLPLLPQVFQVVQNMFTSCRSWVNAYDGGALKALGVKQNEVMEWNPIQYYIYNGLDWPDLREHELFRRVLPYLLRQEDRLGMWFSIENRVPFLDHEFVSFVTQFSPYFLMCDGYLKYPLRVLFPEIPEHIRFNHKKTGYWEHHSTLPDLLSLVKIALITSESMSPLVPNKKFVEELTPLALWRFFQMVVLAESGGHGEGGKIWLAEILRKEKTKLAHKD